MRKKKEEKREEASQKRRKKKKEKAMTKKKTERIKDPFDTFDYIHYVLHVEICFYGIFSISK